MNTQTPWNDESVASNGWTVRENFEHWFDESSVKDRQGQPIVCYHGTGAQFSVFDNNKDGGHYFSTCKETAEFFSTNAGQGWPNDQQGRVVPVFLAIENPFVLDYDGLHNAISESDHYDPQDPNTIHWPSLSTLIEEAKQEGHDGMWLIDIPEYNGKTADQWIAFEPHQIKSAVTSDGLYDPECPDMHGRQAQQAQAAIDYLDSEMARANKTMTHAQL